MRLHLTTAPWLLFCLVSLTGCAWFNPQATRPPTVLTKIQVESPPISSSLSCPPRPTPPAPETATQRDVAAYLRELAAWGEDCEAKLAEVREALRGTQ